ncbi:hypothetical protein GCM10023322_18820 [Rugosimonospora acidiphila]|uniref:Cardiolipin synthase N-terminal domain-containing protein n=1 Tax=Rugosimonospora acidiphila TaxID=556531 RepID=A0ABP9RPL5_9ACTN
MGRLLSLLALADLALIVVALIDCLSAEHYEIRTLPRIAWIFIIVLISPIGPMVWYMAGRPDRMLDPELELERGLRQDGEPVEPSGPGRVLAPDDDPEFLRQLAARNRDREEERLRAWEADLRRRERELRRERERGRDGEAGREGKLGRECERPAEEPPADPKI